MQQLLVKKFQIFQIKKNYSCYFMFVIGIEIIFFTGIKV